MDKNTAVEELEGYKGGVEEEGSFYLEPTGEEGIVLENKPMDIYRAPDGKEFLDKAEAQYYTEKLREWLENYSVYTALTNYGETEDGEHGYLQQNLVLVDKDLTDTLNYINIANLVEKTMDIQQIVKVNNMIVSNFMLENEIPNVDSLKDVESWENVHKVAKRFLEKDNERIINENTFTDSADAAREIQSYTTLIITLAELEGSFEPTVSIVTNNSALRNNLRIIAGDKPYVS